VHISLVTVNFKNARATIALLRSLERQSSRDFDVIVVDNDSPPSDRELLGSCAVASNLRLDVIYSEHNGGFAAGNNIAIRKALAQGAEWIVMINNDTTVDENFIELLRSQLPSEPSLVAIPLREGERIASAGNVVWLRTTLPHLYAHSETVNHSTSLYAIGAGVAIHRDVIERIGVLDERYFLYFEDADYSVRARRAGIPIVFLSRPIIAHRTSETTSTLGSPLLLRYHTRNSILFNREHGPWWIQLATPFWALTIFLKQSLKIVMRRSVPASRAIAAGVCDAMLHRWGRRTTEKSIAIECESLEDSSWGVARMIRGLLEEAASSDEATPFVFHLYFKARVPDEPWLHSPRIRTHVVRTPRWLPIPISFSVYYYLLLPLRLWWDRPAITYWPNYMLPLIAPQPSVVMLTEDIWHQIHNPRLAFRYRAAYSLFSRWAARFATRIMAISHASKLELHRQFGIPLNRISVNELAVNPPKQGILPMPGNFVLFVGQAFERRHLRESIHAFAAIAPRHTEMQFVVIGPDKYEPPVVDALISAANESLGRQAISHMEHVTEEELVRYYAGAKTIIYVSDVEAFGLPPMEALSYGVPGVIADNALNRELYGDAAFFARSGDEQDIAEALERSLTDEAQRARIALQAPLISARYSWSAHARRMLSLFDDMITKQS
jgi:GT2 family glycosyltransferase/glycosyltransferase involved in cell wall biosynthesis